MSTFNLKEFIEKVQAYQTPGYALDNLYQQTVKRRDVWDNLEEIDEIKTESFILKFLNRWKCRVGYVCTSNLTITIRESSELLSKFKNHRLEEVSLGSLQDDSSNIQEVFRRISSVQAGKRTIGSTATSKILHMVNPSFFIMLDKNIRLGYNCSDNGLGYMNFMLKMKRFADELIHEYSSIRNLPMNSAFQSLVVECKSKATTLPKLLDEYNWIKFNTRF